MSQHHIPQRRHTKLLRAIRERMYLDETTGKLYRSHKYSRGTVKGKEVGWEVDGYRYLSVTWFKDGKKIATTLAAHHVVWFLHHGIWPRQGIDHRDGNGRNNHPDNLRYGTQSNNLMNTKIRSDNTSGVKGVSLRTSGKWTCYVYVGGRKKSLGVFDTLEEAKAVRERAALETYQDYSELNRRR